MAPLALRRVSVQRTERIEQQRARLPAIMVEQEVVETVLGSDVVLICGDTGCGKSTQIPQFLYEAGFCGEGGQYLIGVTQPRRVAAVSVSKRVGEELDSLSTVGYQIRYDKTHCSKDMRIKFMTDGILLREVQADFLCRKYGAIVIDEAHERGVNCDMLIGLLSRAVQQRRRAYDQAMASGKIAGMPPPLKLIIMSATLRLCDFTENTKLFPQVPPVQSIDARTFPVTVHFARHTEEDYVKAAHKSVLEIHKQLPPGTILVFVTGRHEVHRLCAMLRRSSAQLFGGPAPNDGEEEQPQGAGAGARLDLLEASDDEGAEVEGGEDSEQEKPVSGKKRCRAAAPAEGLPSGEPAAAAGGKRKKGARRRPAEGGGAPSRPEEAAAAPAGPGGQEEAALGGQKRGRAGPAGPRGKRRKKARAEVPAEAAAEGLEAAAPVPAEPEEELKKGFSFSIDAEEDVVLLDADRKESLEEDRKDFKAKGAKAENMGKLDRSRTAGGVFGGSGFGEGPLRVLPLYAQLPAKAQLAPFEPVGEGMRMVVVATNVAETSVTLPNVRYVVDTGREKRRKYRASSGVSAFTVEHISKASADQRAGRAGRLGPGHTYRLYSAAAYENHFTPFAPIAMLHTPMDPVLLLLAFLGVPRLDVFPWPTPPSPEAVAAAVHRLRAIGAIEDGDAGGASRASAAAAPVRCTQLGLRLAALPVAPRYAKMLLAAVAASREAEAPIIGHACAVVAAMSVGNLTSWESVEDGDDQAQPGSAEHELARLQRDARARVAEAQKKEAPRWSKLRDDSEGLLWIMGGYAWAAADGGEEAADRFCAANRLNPRQMAEAHSLMQQLGALLQQRLSLDDVGLGLELPLRPRPPKPEQAQKLRECIVDGLVDRVAVLCPEISYNAYVCADLGRERPVFVHCSSNVYRQRPRPTALVFNEIVATSRPCMHGCVAVDPMHLARGAAAGSSPLLRLGEFLQVPAPRFLPKQDQVLAFASPKYGPLDFALPTVEVKVAADAIFRYKVFAKALLEGEVIAGVPPAGARLLARPALVLSAPTNPRVAALVGPLWEHRVGSRAELLRRWAEDSRFLLEGCLKWLPPALHEDVRISWPPSGRQPAR
ncbi:unnamed protein product [Prorocentrum cordatum]|uniref:RNA helicase n=1 Tax=Prorocentrum cordatum TaxID=2364126 RepID=A0ABN9VKH1_9DINO|nr:unnamed protein product [Polarella glacialis]